MFDIISIGSATVDILIKSDAFLNTAAKLSLLRSSKNEVSQGLITSGGGASNSSVSFSRLGLKSACLSLIGKEPICQYILNDLSSNGVDDSFLVQRASETTDYSVILVSPDGARSILVNRGSGCLESKHIVFSKLKKTSWLYLTSLEGNLDLLEKLIGFAHENQIKIALNPGSREIGQPRRLIPLLAYVDFLLLNQTESEDLTGINFHQPSFWKKIKSYRSRITAITSGRRGAKILYQDRYYYSPILNTQPVDETGAGDAFGSAFVAALRHQFTPPQALNWAIRNSASVVAHLGAKQGLLTQKQINS